MSKQLVVLIPHDLGRAGARQRLERGAEQLKARFADKVASVEESWDGDRLNVGVKALGQRLAATLDVADDHVRVEVTLPWLLAAIGEKAKIFLQKEGTLLLTKK